MKKILLNLAIVALFATPSFGQSFQRQAEQPNAISGKAFINGWRLCNESGLEPVWVAYSYYDQNDWVTGGWRELSDGECTIIQDRITNKTAYYHASTSSLKHVWGKDIEFCVHPSKQFKYFGDKKSCSAGQESYRFNEVDLSGTLVYTSTLSGG